MLTLLIFQANFHFTLTAKKIKCTFWGTCWIDNHKNIITFITSMTPKLINKQSKLGKIKRVRWVESKEDPCRISALEIIMAIITLGFRDADPKLPCSSQ